VILFPLFRTPSTSFASAARCGWVSNAPVCVDGEPAGEPPIAGVGSAITVLVGNGVSVGTGVADGAAVEVGIGVKVGADGTVGLAVGPVGGWVAGTILT